MDWFQLVCWHRCPSSHAKYGLSLGPPSKIYMSYVSINFSWYVNECMKTRAGEKLYQFRPFRYFSGFQNYWNTAYLLNIPIHIWQMSPQHSCPGAMITNFIIFCGMMMSSHEEASHVTGSLWGKPSVTSALVDSPHKGPVAWSFDVSCDIHLDKLLNNQCSCQWFGILWWSYDNAVMVLHIVYIVLVPYFPHDLHAMQQYFISPNAAPQSHWSASSCL